MLPKWEKTLVVVELVYNSSHHRNNTPTSIPLHMCADVLSLEMTQTFKASLLNFQIDRPINIGIFYAHCSMSYG